jgi:hypothetical protein
MVGRENVESSQCKESPKFMSRKSCIEIVEMPELTQTVFFYWLLYQKLQWT